MLASYNVPAVSPRDVFELASHSAPVSFFLDITHISQSTILPSHCYSFLIFVMAALDLNSIAGGLERLDLDERAPQNIEQIAPPVLVDTPDAVKSLVDTLFCFESTADAIYLDLEGVDLSRHGSISIIQIWVPPRQQAFLVDVHTLGMQAFTVTNSQCKTLKQTLESKKISKYLFDVRNDADALYALFNIQLAGVIDVQLQELASRRGPKHALCGLAACMEQERALSGSALIQWQSTKAEVIKMFDPKLGGSYEVFNKRPLPQILMDYCIGDVQVLPILSSIYEHRLNNQWSEKVKVESVKRLKESRSPDYEPKGKQKMFGPKGWRSPQKKKKKKKKFTSGSTTAAPATPVDATAVFLRTPTQNEVSKSSIRTPSHTDKRQPGDGNLWQRPIAFVPEGSRKGRKGKAKGMSIPSSTGPQADWFEEQNWALCDKDCGWCGHCAEGVL